MDLSFNLSLQDLYNEAMLVDSTGDIFEWQRKQQDLAERPGWLGLKKGDSLEKLKWRYPHDIDKLDFGDLPNLGKSQFTKKWDDQDGISMSMERYYEQLPALIQLKKKDGFKFGKFFKIYVNVGECCFVGADAILQKAICATNITDMLESYGIRVQLSVYFGASDPGRYNGEYVNTLLIDVPIKTFEQPVNKSLIATSLSSWTFRYWILLLMAAKMKPGYGYGSPLDIRHSDWGDDVLYIPTGECHNKKESERMINNFFKDLNT